MILNILNIKYDTGRFFVDSLKLSLKAVVTHNKNGFFFVPQVYEGNINKTWEYEASVSKN